MTDAIEFLEKMKAIHEEVCETSMCFNCIIRNGDTCHTPAPRGSKTGTQGLKGSKERSVIPRQLCDHIVQICENYS